MDLELAGQRALITGASRGLGRAIAEIMAAEGCDVLLTARDRGTLQKTVTAIREASRGLVDGLEADLTEETSRRRVADWAGPVDILINNAGAIPPGNLLTMTDEVWRRAWELKVFGYIALCRMLYPGMVERRTGVILNITGITGERPNPDYIAGSAANAALVAFTCALGKESPRHGVRVVGISPGAMQTDRWVELRREKAARDLGDPKRWPELKLQSPFGRAAKPEEVAAAAAFLVSSRSSYTSGTFLIIDGAA